MSIIIAIIIFGLLIFIHEIGHFLLAKKNGIRVVEFSIGFGPRLFSFDKGDTKYSLKLLPFGGACQMLGDDYYGEEEVDLDHENSFESKSVWARIAVILAGPLFNILLAFLLALVVMGIVGYDEPVVTYVEEGSPLYEAGVRSGDIITEFNGADVTLARELMLELYVNPLNGETITLKYKRDGKEYEVSLKPENKKTYALGITYMATEAPAEMEEITEDGAFAKAGVKKGDIITSIGGVRISTGAELNSYFREHPLSEKELECVLTRDGKEYTVNVTPVYGGESYVLGFNYNTARVKVGAVEAIKYSVSEIKYQIKSVIKSLGLLFKGKLGADDFTGPVGIVDIIDDTYQASREDGALYVFLNIANITLLISANLGMMNLLPIPGLDGGRLVFLLIEAVFRKPVPKKFEGVITAACMIAIMLFAVYVMFNDIRNLF
ncbi:MAG: RIP metalloprotease RseP [Lachnospiraceae bacterium]